MNEADLEYLRNINTRPGPSAGRSIDPTKPGPDSGQRSPEPQAVEREALLAAHQSMENCQHKHHFNAMVMVERALADLAQPDAKPALPQALRDAAENLLIAIGMGWDIEGCVENLRAALAQSNAESMTMRALLREVRPYVASAKTYDFVDGLLRDIDAALAQPDVSPDEIARLAKENHILKLGMEAWPEILKDRDDRLAALAQSDAEPTAFDKTERKLLPGLRRAAYILQQYWEPDAIVPAFDDVQNEIKRIETNSAALVQSDAEPWRCPIGIPPESHSICSVGTCWWCLSDRVKAQSAAEPPRTYPGGRTKAEWDIIARASYERAKGLPDD